MLDKARRFAAQALECAEGDIDYARGTFTVRGTDRSIGFAAVADLAYHGALLPPGCSPGLEVTEFYDPPDTNDPQAIHLAVVVVDADTGAVRLRAFYAADDCGVVINPMIVEGQVHGGLAQGVGQALTERIVYDRSSGQLLTASFLDYGMPRASRSSRVPHHLHRDAGAEQSARRQGRKRERRHRRARRDRQRGDRCLVASRRARHHFADHIGNRMARAARGVPGRRATDA